MNYLLLEAGVFISDIFYEMVKARRNFINFVMHDHEFALWDDCKGFGATYSLCGRHLKKPIGGREAFVRRMISKLAQDYTIVTLEEYSARVKDSLNNIRDPDSFKKE